MPERPGARQYPRLFSEFRLRGVPIHNRVVFAPSHSSWTKDRFSGVFGPEALPYYVERAKGGVGLIIIGATMVHLSSRAGSAAFPQLYDDRNVAALAEIADAVHAHGSRIAIQLYHGGMRNAPVLQQLPGADADAPWYTVAPSQVPLGESPAGNVAKPLSDAEIVDVVAAFGAAAGRAVAAGLDGVEFHLAHGYLPWQFLSPMYNKRSDRWGGSLANRLRFSVEALRAMRRAAGDEAFVGFRVNGHSHWPGDLDDADVCEAVAKLMPQVDVDYVSVTAGVHHAWIHSPMWFDAGWEEPYARAVKAAAGDVPVMMVGRITRPEDAERLLASGAADAICIARQLFADPEWASKTLAGRADDIRECVGANRCWRSAGSSLQCVHNPAVGREATWGIGTLRRAPVPRRVVVIGAGPAGLECARVASERGHAVLVLERCEETGGHVLLESRLPKRDRYRRITDWLGSQAEKHGARIRTGVSVNAGNLVDLLEKERAEHVILATGATWHQDGFQGFTGTAIPGWETGDCVAWTDIVAGARVARGRVLVVDDSASVIGPLVALLVARTEQVSIVTRWPLIAMNALPDMYFEWTAGALYDADVPVLRDHFPLRISGDRVTLQNVLAPDRVREVGADTIVMVTARTSNTELTDALDRSGRTWEAIGDAVAPRPTFDVIVEAHRLARAL
jgi:2,4-dienoyl-CoA reductase-like NADH-dependent reductase (Old Yellow Enzyme family)